MACRLCDDEFRCYPAHYKISCCAASIKHHRKYRIAISFTPAFQHLSISALLASASLEHRDISAS